MQVLAVCWTFMGMYLVYGCSQYLAQQRQQTKAKPKAEAEAEPKEKLLGLTTCSTNPLHLSHNEKPFDLMIYRSS